MDFHNLGSRDDFKQAARDALDKYGCGSCGPRGFYGTIDTHLHCEEDVAKFLGAEAAIIYSDATSTVASALAAFANRADLLVVDDGVNDSVLTGVKLSRSRHIMFKHNDVGDLEEVLRKVDAEDKRLKRKPQRRFIVIEGLYRNYGDIAPFL
jgi:serine palmitoyltransferase